ncbi:fused MFS/spermidine synthase [Massilia aerilata]|uniref:Fused MFS/spermidine synthase n=1 Tax=Massilia aerilata TaxID=453817 RepID=A0ABW0RSM9_9BURK
MNDLPKPLVRTEGDRRTLEFAPGDIQSAMRLSRPHRLVLAYTRAMMCFGLLVPRPAHILLVGLGGGSMAKFCHRHFPDARITVLELRADVIALRDAFLVPPDDARFRVVHAEAAAWMLGAAPNSFDVIVVDGFDESGLPPALSSRFFYGVCRRLLLPGGVLVANVFSYDKRRGEVIAALDDAFDAQTCQLDKVAGNNHILFAGAATRCRAARLLPRLPFGLFNRLCVRLILYWIARPTV